jgi:hypothetical protein
LQTTVVIAPLDRRVTAAPGFIFEPRIIPVHAEQAP